MLKPPCATVRRSRGREPENHREPGPGTRAQAPRSSVDRTRRDRNDWLHRSSYTPPELDKPRTYSQFPYQPYRDAAARPTGGYYARVARAARAVAEIITKIEIEPSPTEAPTRYAKQNAPPEPPMGAHVSRRGFCEENVPSQWRLVYRLFTGVLPVGTSRLPQRHTVHRHFTQAVKHRHFTSTAIETHMPCAAPGHTPRRARGRTRVCRCPA